VTIIVVAGGVMAVDSLISNNGLVVGYMQKWRSVPEAQGGGVVAATGPSGEVSKALDDFVSSGADMPKDVIALHLRADGTVWTSESGPWYTYDADFYAEGFGGPQAMAAMMAGASAEEAAQIACKLFPGSCGGKIHVLSVKQ
jgi:hypothetical protein